MRSSSACRLPLVLLLVGCGVRSHTSVNESGNPNQNTPDRGAGGGAQQGDPNPVGSQTLAVKLAPVSSCSALQKHLRERTSAWMNAEIDRLKQELLQDGDSSACWLAESDPSADSGETDPTSVSQTNNQVANVDEADLVKTDGQYLYLAQAQELRIVDAWPATDTHVAARVPLPGRAKKLFVQGDRVLIYVSTEQAAGEGELFNGGGQDCTYGYDCDFSGDGSATSVMIFDVADRTAPRLARTLRFPGSLIAARRIGATVHTVVSVGNLGVPGLAFPADCGDAVADQLAALEKARTDNQAKIDVATFAVDALALDGDRPLSAPDCADFYQESAGDGQGVTSLVSLDMTSDADPTLAHILSRGGAVYATSDALYMSVSHTRGSSGWFADDSGDEASTVHQFRIGAEPRLSGYLASGLVPGRVLNQFSMDEYQGALRIATTKGHVPSPDVESTLSVLERSGDALELVGQIDHIAPNEDIRSVRFDGARGYLVTFKKTDPLFVLDLAEKTAPKLVGELKIPGFSTYMHQLDATHLLALGYEADDMGSFAYFNGVALQMFDVTDPTAPELLHKKVYGTRGSSSSALTDHLGFTFLPDRGLLTLPLSICDGGGNGQYGKLSFSGMVALDVDASHGFTELGRLEEPYPASLSSQGFEYGGACADWWTNSNSVVERTVVLDDFVYAISDGRVRVQDVSALGTDVARVDF